jgi:broad specificity phosphatase PhoE
MKKARWKMLMLQTDNGRKQADVTGVRLGTDFKLDWIFASPFVRTMRTANLMRDQFPYAVEIIEDHTDECPHE